MEITKIINTSPAIFILGASLVGCNSDNGDNSTPTNGDAGTQNVETGVFLDSPVSGLHYETDTLLWLGLC